eukprot:CAMPEP_0172425358 /NCGR_PEP_ID=MMETSP1064-20121228/31698_1 /TAXON_ID=202472 /ORGANISM="Aulacoseira subarctica , Strain CCAP 1002/5" /LENGTH=348 /DNA_ID=CAMNT_0013168159 /DNA_START=586 /DNA_END=1633 /DNA_ORIENTATION=+
MAAAPRNPSAAHVGPYDYTTRAHSALYDKNTESQVINPAGVLQATYLVDHYGEIPGTLVRNAATVYLTAGARMSQDSEQLHQCVRKSLTKEALSRVMNDKEKFLVNVNGVLLPDGLLFLLTLISLGYTNTRSMSSVYRNQLSLLTQKMQAIPNNNIMEFNTYVKSLVKLLAAGGERCEDLAWNLLRAYKETGDERFTLYIQTKEDAWKDGSINWGANGNEIMLLAENYYKDAVANGTWMQVSRDKERIIALEAQIRTFKPVSHKRDNKQESKRTDREANRRWPRTLDGTQAGRLYLAGEAPAIASAAPDDAAPRQRGRQRTAMTTVTADASSDSEYDTGNESDDSNSS